MKDCNCDLRDGDAKTAVFGSNEMLQPAPVEIGRASCRERV